jgi:hypothetical protein
VSTPYLTVVSMKSFSDGCHHALHNTLNCRSKVAEAERTLTMNSVTALMTSYNTVGAKRQKWLHVI